MVYGHDRGAVVRERLRGAEARGGFSLIEVTIAMGVVAFTLVALIGLLSSGLKVAQQAKTELLAAQVASSILAERRSAPTADFGANNRLPPLTQSVTSLAKINLDRAGQIPSKASDAYYTLFYNIGLDITQNGDATITNGARVYMALVHPAQSGSTYSDIGRGSENYETTTYIRMP